MRQIGTIAGEREVQRLADYLLTLGIRVQVEHDCSGFAVWAIDEDHVARAREEFARFQADPDSERYAAAELEARRLRDELIRKEKERQKYVVDVRRTWAVPRGAPLTILLIAASSIATFITGFGQDRQSGLEQKLTIASYEVDGQYIRWYGITRPGSDVRHGQVWRLVTPIFLHFDPLHLIMNMIALFNLGSIIERRRGTARTTLMVLSIAVLSNLAQYVFHGPQFGGMSGVVFGLFGYAWMKSEFDPEMGIYMPAANVAMMLGFMVLCMTGLVGPIANAAHFGGLVVGILLGYGPVLRRRLFGR